MNRAEKRRRLRKVKKTFEKLGEFEFVALGQTGKQTEADVRAIVPGASDAQIADSMKHFNRCWHFASREYHVAVDKETEHGFGAMPDGGGFWHLSIKRHDREPMNDWRVMQRIKTEIAGPEAEGMELYPAESRVVDTANQYHLWVTIGCGPLPFGFMTGARTDNESGGSAQRPGAGGTSADHWDERK